MLFGPLGDHGLSWSVSIPAGAMSLQLGACIVVLAFDALCGVVVGAAPAAGGTEAPASDTALQDGPVPCRWPGTWKERVWCPHSPEFACDFANAERSITQRQRLDHSEGPESAPTADTRDGGPPSPADIPHRASPPVTVGVCLTGEWRTFSSSATTAATVNNVIAPLGADVYALLTLPAETSQRDLRNRFNDARRILRPARTRVLSVYRYCAEAGVGTSSQSDPGAWEFCRRPGEGRSRGSSGTEELTSLWDVMHESNVTRNRAFNLPQLLGLSWCAHEMLHRNYTWIIRLRTDYRLSFAMSVLPESLRIPMLHRHHSGCENEDASFDSGVNSGRSARTPHAPASDEIANAVVTRALSGCMCDREWLACDRRFLTIYNSSTLVPTCDAFAMVLGKVGSLISTLTQQSLTHDTIIQINPSKPQPKLLVY